MANPQPKLSRSGNNILPPLPIQPALTQKQVNLWDQREDLLYNNLGHLKVTISNFQWFDLPLENGEWNIQVSYPLLLGGYFVPVTAEETWAIAKSIRCYPLTSYIFDQTFLLAKANKLGRQATQQLTYHGDLFDFPLADSPYYDLYKANQGKKVAGGSHKLWILTQRGKSINRGLYSETKSPPGFSTVQPHGKFHARGHWDYSQLLQVMTNLRDQDGKSWSILDALQTDFVKLYDEPASLDAQKLGDLSKTAAIP